MGHGFCFAMTSCTTLSYAGLTDCRSPAACLRFPQRDATRRAEARRRRRRASERHVVGCCGRVGRLSSLESPKLHVNVPLTITVRHAAAVKRSGDSRVDLLMAMTPWQTL